MYAVRRSWLTPAEVTRIGGLELFLGKTGLRAGWSALFFVLVLALATALLIRLFPKLYDIPQVVTPGPALLRNAIVSLLVLSGTWLMARMERRSMWSYGLVGSRSIPRLAVGFGWGVVVFFVLVGLMALSGHLQFERLALQGSAIARYGLAWLAVFLLVGFAEENLFRGYVLSTLARGMGFWPAATILSVGFGLVHLRNSSELILGIAAAALGGIVFSLCLRLTGSLWWGIGFHAAWDWAESFLFGTANSGYVVKGSLLSSRPVGDALLSGGTAGPEASLLLLPVVVAALLVVWIIRKGRKP